MYVMVCLYVCGVWCGVQNVVCVVWYVPGTYVVYGVCGICVVVCDRYVCGMCIVCTVCGLVCGIYGVVCMWCGM